MHEQDMETGLFCDYSDPDTIAKGNQETALMRDIRLFNIGLVTTVSQPLRRVF